MCDHGSSRLFKIITVCMKNFEGIGLLVADIQHFNLTCRKIGKMKVSQMSTKVIINSGQIESCNTSIEYDLVVRNSFLKAV